MFQIDPASLILTNGLMSLAMAAVLLVSRIGLGAEGRGIRSWVLGDMVMSLGRMSAVATIVGFAAGADPNFPAITGACFVFGTAGHLLALRRVAGHADHRLRTWGLAVVVALLFYALLLHTELLAHRLRWMGAALGCSAVITLYTLRPLLRFWGARLIAAMMVLAIATQTLTAAAFMLGLSTELPPTALAHLNSSIRPVTLVIDLVIAIFVTGGFLLLLQERLRARIERLMVTDALTGTLNRHGLMPQLARALAQSQRTGSPMSVVMFDLDHFKRINDVHGHAVGDQVLAGFAATVGAQLRGGDALGRWGGEEFLLLLPDTPLAGAMTHAERLRELVGRGAVAAGAPRVTVSGGVASWSVNDAVADQTQTLLQLLDQADKRLYLAKLQRNCVVGSDAASPAPTQNATLSPPFSASIARASVGVAIS